MLNGQEELEKEWRQYLVRKIEKIEEAQVETSKNITKLLERWYLVTGIIGAGASVMVTYIQSKLGMK